MPRIRIRNVTGSDLVIVPGVPVIPRHTTVTTRDFSTSELEAAQRVLTQLRTLRVIEYSVDYGTTTDDDVDLATIANVYDILSGTSGGGGGSGGGGDWSTGAGRRSYQVVPVGAVNGVNTQFLLPVPIVTAAIGREVVYLNGLTQERGAGLDYVLAESVPLGGYDTLVFTVPPRAGDHVAVDYVPA